MIFPTIRDQNETTEAWIERMIHEVTNAKVKNQLPNGVRKFAAKFIEPGLVRYAKGEMIEDRTVTLLVTKQFLDKIAQSFVGMPVINEVHANVDASDYKRGRADGIVTRVWFEPSDGWYWCEFLVWDEATIRNCLSAAYAVSCAYRIEKPIGPGGEHNSLPYDGEVQHGAYLHLAIVSNPRYEGSRIIALNSKGGSPMWKFWKLGKDKDGKEVRNAVDINGETLVDVGGKKVTLKELIDAHNAKAQKAGGEVALTDTTVIELDGNEVTVADLKNAYEEKEKEKEAENKAKNEADEKEKKEKDKEAMNAAHNSGAHKDRAENCELCNAEKEKEEKETEAKNAAEKAKADKSFEQLKLAAENRGPATPPTPLTLKEQIENGKKLYSTTKAA